MMSNGKKQDEQFSREKQKWKQREIDTQRAREIRRTNIDTQTKANFGNYVFVHCGNKFR